MLHEDVMSRRETAPIIWIKNRPWKLALLAGLGGAFTICILALVNSAGSVTLLIAPFGASCVLVFGVCGSPFSRPRNVVGGHMVTALMGLAATALFGYGPLGLAIGVGLGIAGMILTDTVHPPAGANPIVIAFAQPAWWFLIAPVFIGATFIVLAGMLYHSRVTRLSYPSR